MDRDLLRLEFEKYDLGLEGDLGAGSRRKAAVSKARNSALLREIDSFQRKMQTRILACPLKDRRIEMQKRFIDKSLKPNLDMWLAEVQKHQSY